MLWFTDSFVMLALVACLEESFNMNLQAFPSNSIAHKFLFLVVTLVPLACLAEGAVVTAGKATPSLEDS
jgi:hypothetical protein